MNILKIIIVAYMVISAIIYGVMDAFDCPSTMKVFFSVLYPFIIVTLPLLGICELAKRITMKIRKK